MIKTIAIATAVAALAVPATVQARPAHCPIQRIHVINHAHASQRALRQVEQAAADQSRQLHRAWHTRCVQFSSRGWPLHLVSGHGQSEHYSGPSIWVYTRGARLTDAAHDFTHEIVEALVDPQDARDYIAHTDGYWAMSNIEVADPVNGAGYWLDGVWVTDFVFPSFYAGALSVPSGGCNPANADSPCGPVIATKHRPYDQAHKLTRPWQLTWDGEL